MYSLAPDYGCERVSKPGGTPVVYQRLVQCLEVIRSQLDAGESGLVFFGDSLRAGSPSFDAKTNAQIGLVRSKVRLIKTRIHALMSHFRANQEKNLTSTHLQSALADIWPDLETPALLSLPMLDLTLLVAAVRLAESSSDNCVNFEMTFAEFDRFASRKCSLLRYPRPVLLKCWENLANAEILRPATLHASEKVQREFRSCSLAVSPAEVRAAAAAYPGLLTAAAEWASERHRIAGE